MHLQMGQAQVSNADFEFSGSICIDGSYDQHPVKDLRRASWGAAAFNAAGDIIARARGTVPADWIQSSQSGEFAALAVSTQIITGVSLIFSDCSNVVRDWNSPFTG